MIEEQKTIFPQPFYYIGFSITNDDGSESYIQSLFSDEKGSLKYFLEHEKQGFRYGGWDLPNHKLYNIQLKGLEYIDTIRRVKILENGYIIIQASISEDFLCWANSSSQSTIKRNRIQINTTALIEFTYNGVALLKRVLQDIENPKNIDCVFGFVGIDDHYVLGDGKLPNNGFFAHRNMNSISEEKESKIDFNSDDIFDNNGIGKVSYAILKQIFRMFGFTEDKISYVHKDGKYIDEEIIKNAG